MSLEDARRWDARYLQDGRFSTFTEPRAFLVEQAGWLPRRGLALDVAMGLGGNSAFLLGCGFSVVGVDVSIVAVKSAKARLPDLMAIQADLTHFSLPSGIFDVILNFYYLQRSLWPAYRRWLRPGGLLYFESLTREMLEIQPEIAPQYLLEMDELRQEFSDMEILVYREARHSSRSGRMSAVASIVARLPGSPG